MNAIIAVTIMMVLCCVTLCVNGEPSLFAMIPTNANQPMELYPFIINPIAGDAKQLSLVATSVNVTLSRNSAIWRPSTSRSSGQMYFMARIAKLPYHELFSIDDDGTQVGEWSVDGEDGRWLDMTGLVYDPLEVNLGKLYGVTIPMPQGPWHDYERDRSTLYAVTAYEGGHLVYTYHDPDMWTGQEGDKLVSGCIAVQPSNSTSRSSSINIIIQRPQPSVTNILLTLPLQQQSSSASSTINLDDMIAAHNNGSNDNGVTEWYSLCWSSTGLYGLMRNTNSTTPQMNIWRLKPSNYLFAEINDGDATNAACGKDTYYITSTTSTKLYIVDLLSQSNVTTVMMAIPQPISIFTIKT